MFDEDISRFSPVGQTSSWGVFGPSSEDLVTVPNLVLGPISRKEFTFALVKDSMPGQRSLIGMDLLKDYSCCFLFSENRLLLNGASAPAVDDLYLDRAFHPYVNVLFGEVRASAVWDSGAGITVADTAFIHRHPDLFREVGSSEGMDATGRKMQTPMFTMRPAIIGGREFPPHRVAGVDLSGPNATIEVPMDLILGYSTLSRADWLFDFPNRRWAVLAMLAEA